MATVLALTGDELSLISLQDILESFGHAVLQARTGEAALALVRDKAPDLFLIDILEEGFDPKNLTRTALKARPATKVVAVTAYPRAPLSQAVLEAGAHCLMRKPFEIGRLLEILAEPLP